MLLNIVQEWLGRIDVVVANAGTNRRRSAVNSDWRVWLSLMDINLAHMMLLTGDDPAIFIFD